MKKRNSLLLKLAFGLILLFILFHKVGIDRFRVALQDIDPVFIPAVFIILFVTLILGSLNLRIFMRPLEINVPIIKFIRLYLVSYSLSLITPGRIGGFSLAYFLTKNQKKHFGSVSMVMLVDRAISLSLATIIGVIGIGVLISLKAALIALLTAVLFGLIFLLLIYSEKLRSLIKKRILRKYSKIFKGFTKTFFIYVKDHKLRFLVNLSFTFIIFLTGAVMTKCGFLVFSYNVPIIYILLITMMETVISAIPISVNGLGVKESIGFVFYMGLGVPDYIIMSRYVLAILIRYSMGLLIFIVHKFGE